MLEVIGFSLILMFTFFLVFTLTFRKNMGTNLEEVEELKMRVQFLESYAKSLEKDNEDLKVTNEDLRIENHMYKILYKKNRTERERIVLDREEDKDVK